jgi:hypothetical protein
MIERDCIKCGGKANSGKLFDIDVLWFCKKCFRELYPEDSEWFLYGQP